jgi:hypothetical protein
MSESNKRVCGKMGRRSHALREDQEAGRRCSMTSRIVVLVVLLLTMLVGADAIAHDERGAAEKLGTLHFPVSCAPEAQ